MRAHRFGPALPDTENVNCVTLASGYGGCGDWAVT